MEVARPWETDMWLGVQNGVAAADGAKEAEEWIAQWRSKQKATAKA